MAPRKAIAKRPMSSVGAERRTKSHHDEQPLQSMIDRVITTGRNLDFNFLIQEGFQIGDWLKAQGWERFCSLDIPTYPRLVKSFFEHLRIQPRHLESTVNGTKIILNEDKLSRILEMPLGGSNVLRMENRLEGLKCILEKEDVTGIDLVQANQLSVELRLLHHIISRIIFPKIGRFDWVTERDISLMYFLINGIKVNLPYMIILQISEALKKNRACLPYGMMFTLIFMEHGVRLEGEVSKKLMHTDYYNRKSLHRMGFIKVNERWVKKVSGQMEDEPVAAPFEEPPTEPEAEAGEPSTPVQAPATEEFHYINIPHTETHTTSTVQESFLLDLKKSIFERLDNFYESTQADIEMLRREVIKSHLELRAELKSLSKRISSVEHSGELHREVEAQVVREASKLNKKVEEAMKTQWNTTEILHLGVKDLQKQMSSVLEKLSKGCTPKTDAEPSTRSDYNSQEASENPSGHSEKEPPSALAMITYEAPLHPISPSKSPSTLAPSPPKTKTKPTSQPKHRTKAQVRKSSKPPVHHKPYSTRPSKYRLPKSTKSGVEIISSGSESN